MPDDWEATVAVRSPAHTRVGGFDFYLPVWGPKGTVRNFIAFVISRDAVSRFRHSTITAVRARSLRMSVGNFGLVAAP